MAFLAQLKHYAWAFLKFLNDCLAIFFALLFHPWIMIGLLPRKASANVRLPWRTRIGFLVLHVSLLFAGNFVPRFIFEKWFEVKTADATWVQLASWLALGIMCAGWAAALMSDFVEPLWTNHLLRKRARQNPLTVPDRSLDMVFRYDQDTTQLRFTKECRDWMKVNLAGAHGLTPMSMGQWFKDEAKFVMWFKRPEDAFAFKLRWL